MNRRALGAVLVLALLSGCGQAAGSSGGTAEPPHAAQETDEVAARETSSVARSARPSSRPKATATPELPPGDPGLDAPPVPDPGKPKRKHRHHAPALTSVPREAMLDLPTVSGVLTGSWRRAGRPEVTCSIAPRGVAQRTVGYSSPGGTLVQTVTTHRSSAAADRAVRGAHRLLRRCGWTSLSDPRLGSASVAAQTEPQAGTVVVVAAEGVSVTLVGTGSAATHRARWSAALDIALGNACAAAPEGCH